MTVLREYLRRLWGALRRSPTDPDLERELHFHLEQAEEELRGRGHSPAEAARLARVHLGGFPQVMDALRDQRGWPWLDDLRADVRIGLRMLRRNPLLTLTATVSIALGIGVNSVLFMYADAYMLRPLPVADADAVVTVQALTVEGPRRQGIAYANYRDLRERLSSFEGLFARRRLSSSFARARQESREMRVGMLVSDNFFDVLGVRPERGRTFGPDEGVVSGRDPVVVLSHDFWATVLDADDTVVDDVVWLNGVAFTVIGVTEESFTGIDAIFRPAFYVPAVMAESLGGDEDVLESRAGGRFEVYGRLRPGVSQQAAQAEVEAQWAGLQRNHPDANADSTLAVWTVRQERIRDDPAVAILIPMMMGLAFTVLLIACANVASLLSRWATVRSEVATRMALGGGASRLLRQFLTESLLLALLGTGVGIALSFLTIRLVGNIASQGDGLSLVIEPRMDHRALLFSLTLTGVTAVLAGLAPARHGLKTRLVSLLNSARQGEPGGPRTLGRKALVVVQVALSMALFVTTGLMMDSIGKSVALDPGYRTDRRLRMTLDTSHTRYGPARTRAFYRQLVDGVRTLPGVTSVALASRLPLDRDASVERVIPEGYPLPADREDESVLAAVVDDSYFDTMGTRIRRGRAFDENDTEQSPRVAIVNERFADVYWPGQNPVGRRLRLNGDSERPWLEVVGVAETGKYRLIIEAPTAFVFLPFSQNPRTRMSALVEASTDANAVSLAAPCATW